MTCKWFLLHPSLLFFCSYNNGSIELVLIGFYNMLFILLKTLEEDTLVDDNTVVVEDIHHQKT